jgi:hypothetical protein
LDYDPDTCDPREGQYDTTDNNPHHPDEEDRKPASGETGQQRRIGTDDHGSQWQSTQEA